MQTVPRLYEQFKPQNYKLTIDLQQAAQRTFTGHVQITGVAQSDSILQLHAKGLEIDAISVNDSSAAFTEADDTLTITSDSIAAGHDVTITVDYHGRITDGMHGLYPCYFEHDGQKKELYATQLESHSARELLPCVDEPEAKSTFDLSLITVGDVSALSNMPRVSQTTNNGATTHTFDTTPRMSTYLLAFVVGELQHKSARTKDGVEVNVWATHAQPADSLDFALDVATRSIEFFNDYFGVPYPLPKADHVALPDFSAGAMENWGLITYREICMLADQHTSVSVRQFAATVIAHETSHQWFGNLVTMKWWDDLWLNESFATLMEYICIDSLFPAWNIWMTFATNETLSALRRDYLPGVQSVKTAVHHPDEISTLFDPSIVYAKGARLLAMLRDYIGDDAFKTGLSDYFRTHQYSNTTGNDLWDALSKTSHHDIKGFMTPWLEQPGLPVVHVNRNDDQHVLTQERFVVGESSQQSGVWPIPLRAEPTGSGIPELFTEQRALIPLTPQLHINVGGRGHFISHYGDPDLLDARIRAIKDGEQPDPADRLTLLHDMSLLARVALAKTRDLYELTRSYRNESSEPVWDIIGLVINDLKRFIDTDPQAEKIFKQQISDLVHPTFESLGWEAKSDESESDTKLRATVIGMLIYADNPDVIDRALSDYRSANDLNKLPGELRGLLFAAVAKHGSADDVERLITAHRTTSSSELKGDIASGLTAAQDPALIDRLIGFLMDDQMIRMQDVDRWFIYLMRNRYAREKTWNWMVENWQWIIDTFAGDKSYDNFARYSASALSTDEWLARYREFFDPKREMPILKRAIELGTNDIAARAAWLNRDQADFLVYLKSVQ